MALLSRRDWLKAGIGGAGALAARTVSAAERTAGPKKERWRLALNTSTIRQATLEEKIDAVAKAGYDGIELWAGDLEKYEAEGKSLGDLAKRIRDLGLEVPNVIGIWNSMPPDDAPDRAKALEAAKQKIRIAGAVGARHIAAVPGPDRPDIDVGWAARRYAELVEAGKEFGVAVALEFLGPSKGIHTLGQAAAIVMESGRPEGSIVADTFHMYRGGSAWQGVRLLRGSAYAVWHVNDVPPQPEQFKLQDSDRVYPGDGILPLVQLLKDLWEGGFRGPLSLELFNRQEWQKPPAEVARTGLEKMRALIAKSGTEG